MPTDHPTQTTGISGEPGAGPWASLTLRWSGRVVAEATFATYPCPNAHRCCGWVCRWVVGRTAEQARALTADDLRTVVGGQQGCAPFHPATSQPVSSPAPRRHATVSSS